MSFIYINWISQVSIHFRFYCTKIVKNNYITINGDITKRNEENI